MQLVSRCRQMVSMTSTLGWSRRRVTRCIVFAFVALALAARVSAAPLYFHGMVDDQAQKQASGTNGTPPPAGNLTFGPSGPNAGNATPIQQVMGNPNPDFIPNQLACWWVGGFSGTINGNIKLNWNWQTSNADGVLQGVHVIFKVVADPDFANAGVGTQNVIGADSTDWQFDLVNTPKAFETTIHVDGTVISSLLIQVATTFVNTGPGLTAVYDSPSAPSSIDLYPDGVLGACCDPTSGTCSQLSPAACAASKGLFSGSGSSCSPNPCSIVTPCVLPGVVALVDPPGASDTPPVANPQQDLQSVSIAEPYGDPLGDVFVFTMKVASLDPNALPPNTFWRTTFYSRGASGVPPPEGHYYVAMYNCASGGITYEYGHFDNTGSIPDGPADGGSFSADGSIQITVAKNKFQYLDSGYPLFNVNGDVRVVAGVCPSSGVFGPIDTSTPTTYTIRGNDYCKPHTVSCPANFSGGPGDHPLNFTVNNPSTQPRTYKVSLSDAQSWLVGGPVVDASLGPIAPGGSASLPTVVRMTSPCSPPVDDPLAWSVTAQDLPAPANTQACGTVATCTSTTGVGDGIASFSFGLLSPNPFREEGRFRYTLPQAARVKVEVFGVRGEKLRTLVDREQPTGAYEVSLRLHDRVVGAMGPGIYLVRATLGEVVRSVRVIALQ